MAKKGKRKHYVSCVRCGRQFDANRGFSYDRFSRRYTCPLCAALESAETKRRAKLQRNRKPTANQKNLWINWSSFFAFLSILLSIMIYIRIGNGEMVGSNDYVVNPSQEYVISTLQSVDGIMGIEAVTTETDINHILSENSGGTSAVFFEFSGVDQEQFQNYQSIIDKGTDAGGCIEVFKDIPSMKSRALVLSLFPFIAGRHKIVGTTIVRTSRKLSKESQSNLANEICLKLLNDNNTSNYEKFLVESNTDAKFVFLLLATTIIFIVLFNIGCQTNKRVRNKVYNSSESNRAKNPIDILDEQIKLDKIKNKSFHNTEEPEKEVVTPKRDTKRDYEKLMEEATIDYQNWMREMRGLTPLEDELRKIDYMDGYSFENWCANLLRHNGYYNVTVTRSSGDHGVDVIAEMDGLKYAVQCKRQSKDCSNRPIQEVTAGKAFYHCHVGAVMTNQYFTNGAKELAEVNGILLWDRDTIINMLKKELPF